MQPTDTLIDAAGESAAQTQWRDFMSRPQNYVIGVAGWLIDNRNVPMSKLLKVKDLGRRVKRDRRTKSITMSINGPMIITIVSTAA